MNETTKIINKANEIMTHSKQEQLDLTRKVAAGEITKEGAVEILDELEKKDLELIAQIDRELERLDKPLGGISSGHWKIWLALISLAVLGLIIAWYLFS